MSGWEVDLAWDVVKPNHKKRKGNWVTPSREPPRNSWKELDAELKKVQEILGTEWSYDHEKEVFRQTSERPWFTFNPDTNQYHDEKEGLYYNWNKYTENFEESAKRESKKYEYIQNFKRSLKEFLGHVSNRGLPRSQLLSSITRLRTRAEQGYRNEHSKISIAAKLEEATKELLNEKAGGYIDTKGKKVQVEPPYTCPLCGRSTSNPDTLLAHIKLHEYCTKHGLLSAEAKQDPDEALERLLHSEALFVVGTKAVQTAVEMAVNKSGLNNRKRYQAYTYMKQRLGIAEHEDFSCDVIHAVRAAFPEAHGCYSGRHNCKSFEKELKAKRVMQEPASVGYFGNQPNKNFKRGSLYL